MTTRPAAQRRHLASSPFNASRVEQPLVPTDYEIDDRVCHDRHGLGRVVKVEGGSVIVDFGAGVHMRLTDTSTKLTKL